ncbi:MAG: ATP phosphoribosyltransferase regulatory subunit [Litorilinea sp.]|nr:MAG: ATP phosphoribosyltransferase regulatory subunit [Litorilinea sp.]
MTVLTISPGDARIPQGVADYFWEEAYQRRQLEGQLLALFRRWGYGDVIPPMFEYADTLNIGASPRLQQEMYRFLDRDGHTLALRPDMTIPVARLVGARLHDWPMPQRFCYAGSVFRYTEPQAGRQREFFQAGVELIGANTPEADAEVLALTAHGLEAAGLTDFRLVVGQIQYFRGLLEALGLTPAQEQALQQAIDRNSAAELNDFLEQTPLPPEQQASVLALAELSGANVAQVLERAGRYCLNRAMAAALDNLRAISQALDAYGVGSRLYLDLTEIHNLGYYTGITFEVLAPQLGFPLASGGRYDNLVGAYGHPQPAVGVAIGLDRLLLARRLQERQGVSSPTRPIAPDLLVATGGDRGALAIVQQWREAGLRVAVDVDGRGEEALAVYARSLGIPLALTWTGSGFHVHKTAGDSIDQLSFWPAAESFQRGQALLERLADQPRGTS